MFLVDFIVNSLRLVFIEQWPVTLTVVLGFAAIYLLLPQPQRKPILFGGAAAAAAILALCVLIVRVGGLTVESVLFYVFALVSVVAGGLLVTQQNPARAALAFALLILAVCGLFLLQAAPFLMAATIIVYAGAIIVTFLFVLMLAQQQGIADADGRSREPFLASATGFVLLGALLYLIQTTYHTDTAGWLNRLQPQVAKMQEMNQRIEQGQQPSDEDVLVAVQGNLDVVKGWKEETENKEEGALKKALMVAYDDLYEARGMIDSGRGADLDRLLILEDELDTIRQAALARSGTLAPLSRRADLEDPVRYFVQANKELPQPQAILPLRAFTHKVSLARQAIRRLKAHPEDAKLEIGKIDRLLEQFALSWENWQEAARAKPDEAPVKALTAALNDARKSVAQENPDLDSIDKSLEKLRATSLQTRAELRLRYEPMSAMSGPPSSVAPGELRRNEYGEPQLPAENAAYLGQSLFSDYLLAVEMGGMLLLVATVGAIAITTRHKTVAKPTAPVLANGTPPRRHP